MKVYVVAEESWDHHVILSVHDSPRAAKNAVRRYARRTLISLVIEVFEVNDLDLDTIEMEVRK